MGCRVKKTTESAIVQVVEDSACLWCYYCWFLLTFCHITLLLLILHAVPYRIAVNCLSLTSNCLLLVVVKLNSSESCDINVVSSINIIVKY